MDSLSSSGSVTSTPSIRVTERRHRKQINNNIETDEQEHTDQRGAFLEELSLRNFQVLGQLDVDFDPKFNLIHGDNGIGKSTLLKAIQLVLRASDCPNLLRSPPDEGIFVSQDSPPITFAATFKDKGLPDSSENMHRLQLVMSVKDQTITYRFDSVDIPVDKVKFLQKQLRISDSSVQMLTPDKIKAGSFLAPKNLADFFEEILQSETFGKSKKKMSSFRNKISEIFSRFDQLRTIFQDSLDAAEKNRKDQQSLRELRERATALTLALDSDYQAKLFDEMRKLETKIRTVTAKLKSAIARVVRNEELAEQTDNSDPENLQQLNNSIMELEVKLSNKKIALKELDEKRAQLAELNNERRLIRKKLTEQDEQLNDLFRELEKSQKELVVLKIPEEIKRIKSIENSDERSLEFHKSELEAIEASRKRLELQRQNINEELEKLAGMANDFSQKKFSASQNKNTIDLQIEQLRSNREDLLSMLRQNLRNEKIERTDWFRNWLMRLDRHLPQVLESLGPNHGFYGLVLQHIEVLPAHRIAVDAAKTCLRSFLVRDVQVGLSMKEAFRNFNLDILSCRFICVDDYQARRKMNQPLPKGVTPLSDLIQIQLDTTITKELSSDELKRIISSELRPFVFIDGDSIDAIEKAQKLHDDLSNERYTFVTEDGDTVSRLFVCTGALKQDSDTINKFLNHSKSKQEGRLWLNKKLTENNAQLIELTQQRIKLDESIVNFEKTRDSLVDEHAKLRSKFRVVEQVFSRLELARERAQAVLRTIQTPESALQASHRDLLNRKESLEKEIQLKLDAIKTKEFEQAHTWKNYCSLLANIEKTDLSRIGNKEQLTKEISMLQEDLDSLKDTQDQLLVKQNVEIRNKKARKTKIKAEIEADEHRAVLATLLDELMSRRKQQAQLGLDSSSSHQSSTTSRKQELKEVKDKIKKLHLSSIQIQIDTEQAERVKAALNRHLKLYERLDNLSMNIVEIAGLDALLEQARVGIYRTFVRFSKGLYSLFSQQSAIEFPDQLNENLEDLPNPLRELSVMIRSSLQQFSLPPIELSGGQQAILATCLQAAATISACDNCFFLLDEIDESLDISACETLGNILRMIAQRNQIFCISHRPHLMTPFCERLVELQR